MAILYPVLFKLTSQTSEKWQEIEHQKNERLDDAFGRFTEVVAQMRVVKSFRQGRREFNRFQNKFGEVVPLTDTQSRYWHRQDILRRLVVNIIFAAMFGLIVWQTARGDLTTGEFVLPVSYTHLTLPTKA